MKPRRPGRGTKAAAAKSPYRILIVFALVGALGIFYAWNTVFLGPKGRQKTAVDKQLAAARQQETDLRTQLAALKKVAADTQSREAELARLGRLVPADADVAGAILVLNDTANQAQVNWASFVPTPVTAGAGGTPATLGVGMKVSGTFPQVFDYLSRLETLDRLVVVDSVVLSGAQQPNGQIKVDADLKARMFAATGPAPAAPAAAAAPATGDTSKTVALPKDDK